MTNKSENMTFIGMSGTGKSTIGKELSKLLNKQFLDLDKQLCHKHNSDLQSILNKLGDKDFLKEEEKACLEISFNNIILSPGGSLIYSQKAVEYCKKNSILIFLDTSFDTLKKRQLNVSNRGIVGLKRIPFQIYLMKGGLCI